MKVAFVGGWLVIALGVWLGYQITHPGGLSIGAGKSALTATSIKPTTSPEPPPLTVQSVFAAKPVDLSRFDRNKLRTLVATGDVIPGRSVNYRMVTLNDFLYPFRPTASVLRTGDITLINLEAPLIPNCPLTDSGMSFCGDQRDVQGLKYAGFDVACTANNHIGNYGQAGIDETWRTLASVGIQHCGLGSVAHVTVRGLRFAFLAYNCVGERFDYAVARREIQAARKTADVVIVSVHWGKEYVAVPQTEPGIADDDPVKVGHWIVDSGADLVVGNHPHHVQAVEMYHNHYIAYAHGNFAFDQMFSDETRQGVVGFYTFYGRRLVSVRYRPVFIYDYSQPRWATPQQASTILNTMRTASQDLRKQGR